MSLATRCTACDTVFRVVQDQLKVSEGWVRCGRCDEVFNALEGLFDLEPEPALGPALAGPVEPPVASDLVLADEAPAPPCAPPETYRPIEPIEPIEQIEQIEPVEPNELIELTGPISEETHFSSRPVDLDATPAARVAERDRIEFADAQFSNALLAEAGIEIADEPADAPPPVAAPEFLRQAERQAQWDRPRTVVGLSLLCLVLGLAMALQVTAHFRDLLATLVPQTRAALQAACELAGCSIEPLRRIEDVVIESSALTSAPNGSAVRLSVVLRNRGPLPLAIPSIELTLTDPGGQVLVRRALSPSDFGVANATLPPASESPLQLVMATSARRASGYTVEPFYP
jgi:predicted Zn finger-like uncharacterized protein